MHISEGVLSLSVLAFGGATALVGLAFGVRRLGPNDIPKTALLTAAFFLASLVHVPIGPSSVHLILNGFLGVLLGWSAFPAIFTALVLQAVLFQFGGLTTLGVNTVIMAVPAIFFGLPVRWLIGKKVLPVRTVVLASGAAGACSVLGSGLLAAVSLALSGEAFSGVARLILLVHLPVAGIEAVITSLSVAALLRMRPEMILIGRRGDPLQDAQTHSAGTRPSREKGGPGEAAERGCRNRIHLGGRGSCPLSGSETEKKEKTPVSPAA